MNTDVKIKFQFLMHLILLELGATVFSYTKNLYI